MKIERHLDMTPDELSELILHPMFLPRWSDHLDRCDRCYALFKAATVSPAPERPGEDPYAGFGSAMLIAIGRDRPGLAHSLSSLLNVCGCTIETARMRQLGGHFTILLRVLGDPDGLEAARRSVARWGEAEEIDVKLHRDAPAAERASGRDLRLYRLRAAAHERAGVVDELTAAIAEAGGDVKQLDGRIERRESGPQTFDVQIDLALAEADLGPLMRAVRALDVRSRIEPVEAGESPVAGRIAELRKEMES